MYGILSPGNLHFGMNVYSTVLTYIVRMAQLGCFCLCEIDFVDCSCPEYSKCLKYKEKCVPHKKKKHLSLTHFQFLSEDEFVKLKEGYTPTNTEGSTKWAINNCTSWKITRERSGKSTRPDHLLQSTDPELLCDWLSS